MRVSFVVIVVSLGSGVEKIINENSLPPTFFEMLLSKEIYLPIVAFIIFISMIGFSLNWLKMDSFRIYFFWLCLALIWIVESRKKMQNE